MDLRRSICGVVTFVVCWVTALTNANGAGGLPDLLLKYKVTKPDGSQSEQTFTDADLFAWMWSERGFIALEMNNSKSEQFSISLITPAGGPLRVDSFPGAIPAGYTTDLTRPQLAVSLPGFRTVRSLDTSGSFEVQEVQLAWKNNRGAFPVARFTFRQRNPDGVLIEGEVTYRTATPLDVVNFPPGVYAGMSRVVWWDDPIALPGIVSDDDLPVGRQLTGSWQASGPAPVTFDDAASFSTTAHLSKPGTYALTLTGSDGEYEIPSYMTLIAVDRAFPTGLILQDPNDLYHQPVQYVAASDSNFVGTWDNTWTTVRLLYPTGSERWSFRLSGPANAPLHAGRYETAQSGSTDISRPRLEITNFSSVAFERAVVNVRKVVYSAGGQLLSFWADFELFPKAQASITGEIRLATSSQAAGVNRSPEMLVGPDQHKPLGSDVTLSAIADDDGLPGPMSVDWKLIAGPGPVAIADEHALTTGVTFQKPGRYTFSCAVADGYYSRLRQVVVGIYDPADQALIRVRQIGLTGGEDFVNESWSSATGDFVFEDSSREVLTLAYYPADSPVRSSHTLTFAAPSGSELVPGDYLGATRLDNRKAGLPAFRADISRTVGNESPAFRVLELERAEDGRVSKFHAVFRVGSDSVAYPAFGEICYRCEPSINTPPVASVPNRLVAYAQRDCSLGFHGTDSDQFPGLGNAPYFYYQSLDQKLILQTPRKPISIYLPGTYLVSGTPSDGFVTGVPVTQEILVLEKYGTFSGQLVSEGKSAGSLRLVSNEGLSFTGVLQLKGVRLRFAGSFASDGSATLQLTEPDRTRLTLRLRIREDGLIDATLDGDGIAAQAELVWKGKYETGYQGNFALTFPASDERLQAPLGSGFGLLRVTATGSFRIIAALPDATVWSYGGWVPNGEGLSFTKQLYKGKGLVEGTLNYNDHTGDYANFTGSMHWQRPPGRHFSGWDTQTGVRARLFTPVGPRNPLVLADRATFLAYGSNGESIQHEIAVLPHRKLKVLDPGPDGLVIRSDGVEVTGKWRDPISRKIRQFAGILFWPDGAEGFYLHADGEGGAWFLRPHPQSTPE